MSFKNNIITIGNPNATNSHFKITAKVSSGKVVIDPVEFDVYAETAEEVLELINAYFDGEFQKIKDEYDDLTEAEWAYRAHENPYG